MLTTDLYILYIEIYIKLWIYLYKLMWRRLIWWSIIQHFGFIEFLFLKLVKYNFTQKITVSGLVEFSPLFSEVLILAKHYFSLLPVIIVFITVTINELWKKGIFLNFQSFMLPQAEAAVLKHKLQQAKAVQMRQYLLNIDRLKTPDEKKDFVLGLRNRFY